MCLSLPAEVIWIGDPTPAAIPARARVGEILHDVDLVMIPDAQVGDHIVVHSGYGLRAVPADRARETLDIFGLGGADSPTPTDPLN